MKPPIKQWEKLIKKKKQLKIMIPDNSQYIIFIASIILICLSEDLKLHYTQNICASIVLYTVGWCIAWIINAIIYKIQKNRFEKSQEYKELTQEELEQYNKQQEDKE